MKLAINNLLSGVSLMLVRSAMVENMQREIAERAGQCDYLFWVVDPGEPRHSPLEVRAGQLNEARGKCSSRLSTRYSASFPLAERVGPEFGVTPFGSLLKREFDGWPALPSERIETGR